METASGRGRVQRPGRTDVIVPLGSGSVRHDWELRYLLRSLEKHAMDLGRVWIVTDRPPSWLNADAVEIVRVPDVSCSKSWNIMTKMVWACCRPGISTPVAVRCHDDYVLVSNVVLQMLPVARGRLLQEETLGRIDLPLNHQGTKWGQMIVETVELLRRHGVRGPVYHYDCHCPQPLDPGWVRVAFSGAPFPAKGYGTNTMLYNLVNAAIGELRTVHMDDIKATVEEPVDSVGKLWAMIEGKLFLGYTDAAFNQPLGQLLEGLFPKPSRFEL